MFVRAHCVSLSLSVPVSVSACVSVCVCVCVRACVRACARAPEGELDGHDAHAVDEEDRGGELHA